MQEPKVERKSISKKKGNSFENKIAKELGQWMFCDKHMLGRHPTSGAIKSAWLGDIIPQKQLPTIWKSWPFYIECKSGYGNQICTLNNQTIVRTWIDKCYKDLNGMSKIILLIINFKGYGSLLITNYKLLKVEPHIIIVHNSIQYNIYEFKELIQLDFLKIFGWSND